MQQLMRRFEIAFLLISCCITITIMLFASRCRLQHIMATFWFLCWAISPYVIFYFSSSAIHRRGTSLLKSWSTCIVSFIMLAFTSLVYIDAFFFHISSTSALVFLFVPLYLIVGSFVFMGIILGIGKITTYLMRL